MHAQTDTVTQHPLPAVATLFQGMRAAVCACCQGTGSRGRSERLVPMGDGAVILTATHWCEQCRGTGKIFTLEPTK